MYSFIYSSSPAINIIVRTDQFVDTTVRDAETNMVCDRPRDNWLVFTAGCMGAGEGRGEIMNDTEDMQETSSCKNREEMKRREVKKRRND